MLDSLFRASKLSGKFFQYCQSEPLLLQPLGRIPVPVPRTAWDRRQWIGPDRRLEGGCLMAGCRYAVGLFLNPIGLEYLPIPRIPVPNELELGFPSGIRIRRNGRGKSGRWHLLE